LPCLLAFIILFTGHQEPAEKNTKTKEKKEKKKGRKGPKDPTADRSIQSLYAELVSMNIVINYPTSNTKLADFVNIYNYNQTSPTSPSLPTGEKVVISLISITFPTNSRADFVVWNNTGNYEPMHSPTWMLSSSEQQSLASSHTSLTTSSWPNLLWKVYVMQYYCL
jgi:hypothetical protein